MSVWLCREEPVKRPFYIRELDLRIFSSHELSYVMIHNPLFVLEDFVDDRLFEFVREQLDLGSLSLKMERLKRSGESDCDILSVFLQEAGYCTPPELSQFRQQAVALKKMPQAEYRKARADYLFRNGQYLKAVNIYQRILEMPRDASVNEAFIGKIYANIGACYTRLFQYERAVKGYEKSYFFCKDDSVLRQLYFLSVMVPELEMSERSRELLASEMKPEWQAEYEDKRAQVMDSKARAKLAEIFEKDSIRRQQGVEELLGEWKRKYRSMQTPS